MSVSNVFGGRFVAIPAWSIGYISLNGHPRDLQVLAVLAEMMNVRTMLIHASIPQIAEASNLSKETVKRSLKWLSDHYVITITERKRPQSNVYRINYEHQLMGSPVTPYRVTHDPINGSPMTLSQEGNGVTGDPIKSDKSPARGEDLQSPRIITLLDNEKEKIKTLASEGGTVDDMIFGADPEYVEPERKPKVSKGKRTHPEVKDLTKYFIYHPRAVMLFTFDQKDMAIVRRALKLLFEGGLTRSSIRQMIDRFYDNDKVLEATSPALLFASKKVQKNLMDSVGFELDSDTDPILLFMVNDFTRGDFDLPWTTNLDKVVRDTILMYGMDICYRYPELVAELIRHHHPDLDSHGFQNSLEDLNSLVRWYLGKEDVDPQNLRYTISSLHLPKELRSNKQGPIRPASDTIASAIYTYQRATRTR